MSWATVPPPPTAQPFRGTGRGTFSESGAITDSGTVEIAAQDVALPSPIVGIVEAHFTLISDARTLSLRCKQSSTDSTISRPFEAPVPAPLSAEPGCTQTCTVREGQQRHHVPARTDTNMIDLSVI